MRNYDVVIVGASIAGCTAATLLGRAGASVALVEKHSDRAAYKRICTHLIQSSASPTIQRLGLEGAIEQAGAQPNDLRIWTRYGWVSFVREQTDPPMRDHPTWNIRREKLDPMLRELAAGTAGVELIAGFTATALLNERGRTSGVTIHGRDGSDRDLHSRLVVAADGRESTLARLAGASTEFKPNSRFGYFAYYRDTPLRTGGDAQAWLLDPDIAYAFPTDGGLTLLACMPHKSRLCEFKDDPEQAMARVFETLPDGPLLDPGKRESKVMGKLDMPTVIRRSSRPGLALVGDAALAADPVWGVGCGWALQSAEWLADAVSPALASGDSVRLDGALRAYTRRHREGLDAHEKFCSAYSTGHTFDLKERLFYRAAARDPQLAARLASVGARWIQPQRLLTQSVLGRLVWFNVSRRSRPVLLGSARSSAGMVS